MQGVRSPDIQRLCEACGVTFTRKAWQMPTPRSGRFCSRACSLGATGTAANRWGGGERISQYGYRQVRVGRRYVFEHRLVAEQALGRALRADEKVHHLNGDKLDNRPENLAVMPHGEHMRLHQSDPEWTGPVRAAARRSSPAKSEAMRRRWADPAERSAMTRAIRVSKGLTAEPAQRDA